MHGVCGWDWGAKSQENVEDMRVEMRVNVKVGDVCEQNIGRGVSGRGRESRGI